MDQFVLQASGPSAWETIKPDVGSLISELTAALQTYSYEEDAVAATDEHLCSFLMAQLRTAKHRLLPAMSRAHALAGKGGSGYHDFEHAARLLRDDLDIFSDEIKMRRFSWSPLEADWLKMLVRKDHELVAGARRLVAAAEQLDADLSRAESALQDVGFWPALAAHLGKARAQLAELVRTFKERENICNLKKFEFAKTLAQLKRASL